MNTGTIVTEATLTNAVGSDVVWNVLENNREYMEKKFGKVTWLSPEEKKKKRGFLGFGGVGIGGKNGAGTVVGTPPAAPDHVKERAAFMVHGAARLTDDVRNKRELIVIFTCGMFAHVTAVRVVI